MEAKEGFHHVSILIRLEALQSQKNFQFIDRNTEGRSPQLRTSASERVAERTNNRVKVDQRHQSYLNQESGVWTRGI